MVRIKLAVWRCVDGILNCLTVTWAGRACFLCKFCVFWLNARDVSVLLQLSGLWQAECVDCDVLRVLVKCASELSDVAESLWPRTATQRILSTVMNTRKEFLIRTTIAAQRRIPAVGASTEDVDIN